MLNYFPLTIIFLLIALNSLIAQNCQTYDIHCDDAYLRHLSPDTNYGDHTDFRAGAWTNQGDPVNLRGVMNFQNFSLPENVVVDSAFLFLYGVDSPFSGQHSSLSGSNEAEIFRITSEWQEYQVTWNNMPSIDETISAYLPMSTIALQDYKVDVLELINAWQANPTTSHGFMIKLVTEQYYRNMVFASCDWPEIEKRPVFKICYDLSINASQDVFENSSAVDIYPNPISNGIFNISTDLELRNIEIFSLSGALLRSEPLEHDYSVSVDYLSEGFYIIRLTDSQGKVTTKSLIVIEN